MFNFGIEGYQPRWLRGGEAIVAAHGDRLSALAGRTLRRVWLVWDLAADQWFADCPVVLDFGSEQVEVNHQKFDDLSITWNSVDLRQPVRWPEFDLEWRAEPVPELTALAEQAPSSVALLEYVGEPGDLANGAVALGFTFPTGHLVVHNALDENGLDFDPPDRRYRSLRLA